MGLFQCPLRALQRRDALLQQLARGDLQAQRHIGRDTAEQPAKIAVAVTGETPLVACLTQDFGHVVRQDGAALQTEQELHEAAAKIGTTIFHPVGTCRMGQDAEAVVDAELRVHGIAGLRVADASIMPTIVSGNTCSPTLMIGEKAAQLILATPSNALEIDAGISRTAAVPVA